MNSDLPQAKIDEITVKLTPIEYTFDPDGSCGFTGFYGTRVSDQSPMPKWKFGNTKSRK